MSYKKRAKNGWCDGKSYKRISNSKERMHEKEEIRAVLNEIEDLPRRLFIEDVREEMEDMYPPRKELAHKEKQARNSKLKKERKIKKYSKLLNWYEKIVKRYDNNGFSLGSYIDGFKSSCRANIVKYKEKLNKLKKDVDK